MWKAPETLLPRIMSAIEHGRSARPVPFLTWPFPVRTALAALACMVLAAGLLLINELLNTARQTAEPVIADLMHGLDAAWALAAVFESVMKSVTSSGAALCVLAAVGMMMTLTWLGICAGFVYIVKDRQERTT